MYKIAVIGECMVELYQNNEGLYKQTFGGDTFNCAVYLKRSLHNARVEYVTVSGEESLSSQMMDFFHNEDIQTNYIDKLSNKTAGLYIIHTTNGERSFSYWRSDSAAKKLFMTKSLKKMQSDFMKFDLIYFSAITLAIMSEKGRNNLYHILETARKKGVKVAYDPNYRPRLYDSQKQAKALHVEALKYCDIYLPSQDDENNLWGEMSVEEIIQNAKCPEVVVKRGAKEIVYNFENVQKEVKIKKIKKIIDSTSAGDSFNGAYLAARLEGTHIDKAIEKANKLASEVIMQKGAIIPR